MYTPASNRIEDRARHIAFMREYNFAALVTGTEGRLLATHLPFMVIEDDAGLRLQAHISKAHPQWQDFAECDEVLVIFASPHASISPSLYGRKPSVPTWNYVAVHSYGTARLVDRHADKMPALDRLINAHEPDYQKEFVLLPADYLAKMLEGIVAFEIEVKRIDARFKLSQKKSAAVRERIAESLMNTGRSEAHAVAEQLVRKL